MNLFRILLTACCCCLLIGTAESQSSSGGSDFFHDCPATHFYTRLLRENPKLQEVDRALEADWSQQTERPASQKSAPPYTLPIVFHIVHENGAENIGNDDILRSLEFTNQAFANTDYYDQGTGANTQIQFCLARRTPDNQPTNGINRIVSPLTELTATEEDRDLKDLMRWSPREYINVWVVKEICGLGLGCGVAGYAYYPGAHGGTRDGIVLEARWLAGNEARVSVLIHELGHYLGLRHTFDGGCKNDDCTVDGDAVCDTPPDQSKAAVPCSGTANSCTTDTDSGFATDQNDMFINYMDYGRFACYSAFTAGQRDRMHFFIEGRRRSLLTSLACSDPCPAVVDANFSGGDVTVDIGTTINFTNLSSNGDRYSWRINGTEFATSRDASNLFSNEGTYRISLLVESNDGLCSADSVRQTVTVICPIVAGFTLPDTLEAGREVTFTNTSVATTEQLWNVATMDVSTDQDLTFTFDSAGLYRVCLSVNNGFCDEDLCRTIFVSRPPCTDCPVDSCKAAFVLAYESTFNDENAGEFTVALPYQNGFAVAGSLNGLPTVSRLDEAGSPLWSVQLFPNGNSAIITQMIIDQEGMLAGFGSTRINAQELPFIFRIDPTNGSLLWGHTFPASTNGEIPYFKQIVHAGRSEPYRLFGYISSSGRPLTNSDALLVTVNPNDGSLVNGLAQRYDLQHISEFVDALYAPTEGLFYVLVNRYNSIPSGPSTLLFGLDFAGDLQQAVRLEEPGLFNVSLGVSLDYQDGSLAVLCTNRERGSGDLLSRVYQVSTNTSSFPFLAVTSARDYKDDRTSLPTKIAANDLGHLMAMVDTTSGERLLRQIDPNGEIIWSRAYPNLGLSTIAAEVSFSLDDQHILLPGYLNS
ncbi:MAG: M43 family zinc metalloprotease, partial [Bacteroidota bacterium]